MEDDSESKKANDPSFSRLLELPLETPGSLALLTNDLLTPETKIIYKL
jgi:hypothetical protein